MKKILPLILIIIGVAAGGGAGLALRPTPNAEPETDGSDTAEATAHAEQEQVSDAELLQDETAAFVKINNQFVVPLLDETRVRGLVVLSISLKVEETSTDTVYNREPLFRDAFLQVLFDHAFLGGFDGAFTTSQTMASLKDNLLSAAERIAGPVVQRVLITDIVRQDL